MKGATGPKKSYVPNILGSVFGSLKVRGILLYHIFPLLSACANCVNGFTARFNPAQLGDQSREL